MPKASKKYYAVAVGRDGPNIYTSWDECNEKVTRFPRAVFKSFPSYSKAQEWLASQADVRPNDSSRPDRRLISGLHSVLLPDTLKAYSGASLQTTKPPAVLHKATAVSAKAEIIEEEYISLRTPPPGSHSNPPSPRSYSSRPSVLLSHEQRHVLDQVKSGRSIFFTGSAGTGKSVLLGEIINTLREQGTEFGITASTGIAAINIGGCTLHSWAGVGLGNEDVTRYIGKFYHNENLRQVLDRWKSVQTLIIDEVSMIDGSLFDKLENIARALRENESPFGGIQLVLSGDFCQLPPVSGRSEKGQQVAPIFAFDAMTWDACVGSPILLTRVFRQKDQDFADMLNAMRFGRMDTKAVSTFSTLSREVKYTDGIGPTELFSTRQEVSHANDYRLRRLDTETRSYLARDRPGIDSNGKPVSQVQMNRLLERLVVPNSIALKVGAQVMLVKNLEQGELVNGSVGQVVRFSTTQDALKTGTSIAGVTPGEKKNLPREDTPWPVVRFIGGRETLIVPYEFTIDNADGNVEAARTQVPLILAWALSIHKSQGQTLERVKVDLKRVFEVGQAYVALSRATSLGGLQVLNFNPAKVIAHPRVLQWYGDMVPVDDAMTDNVIELSDSDESEMGDLKSGRRTTAIYLSQEVIDLTESEDESYGESWYYDP